ncbi:thiolase family protein [Nitriliruptoraceae bacterium ZYF776]|nr:thiolase family protein [Profundirhabdus halotolerans]
MARATIVGTGMTRFGKFPDRTVRSLAEEAARAAMTDAGVTADDVERVFFGNAVSGLMTGQEMIRGQIALRDLGLGPVPVLNVENACASGSSAVHQAVTSIEAGQSDLVLVVGAEKLTHEDKRRSFEAIGTAVDLERLEQLERDLYGDEPAAEGDRSFFMDVYADMAKRYMARSGATEDDFAAVAVKSHDHAAHNPLAQYRDPVTVEQVLASRHVSGPLTLLMCSPIGDGAAALLLASEERAAQLGADAVQVAASVLVSGLGTEEDPARIGAHQAYDQSGLGPDDVDVVEVHDAAAPAELIMYEELGLCAPGEGPKLLASGETRLGGRVPVNPSGGLISKGHPVGATGVAQLVELTDQLRGRCEGRQVDGARVALAENGGGYLGPHPAAVTITMLRRG